MAELTQAHITVTEPGLTTVQDLGRARGPRSGQMTGGALDQYSARMANTLVASDPEAPLFELVAHDFAATAEADLLVAITGADADVTVDGRPQPQWEPVVWPAGTRLAVRKIRAGLRIYLAVHGTLHCPRLMGSCAPDTVLGFGSALGRGAVATVTVDCPRVVQPWFDIPFFRLGARPHPYAGCWHVDLTDGPDAA
jgi:allophanate hydrolase subunit 2